MGSTWTVHIACKFFYLVLTRQAVFKAVLLLVLVFGLLALLAAAPLEQAALLLLLARRRAARGVHVCAVSAI